MNEKGKLVKTFLLGLILGGALAYTGLHFTRHWGRGRPPWGPHRGFGPGRMLAGLSRKLDLTAEQKKAVEKILEAKLPKMKELKASLRPRFEALRQETDKEIRALLNPGQQIKFDKLLAEFEARRQKWEEAAPPPPLER